MFRDGGVLAFSVSACGAHASGGESIPPVRFITDVFVVVVVVVVGILVEVDVTVSI